MKGLDNYIMGINKHGEDDVLHQCPECREQKRILMLFDMGGWFYRDDDDPYCEKCNRQMEVWE